ncbi:hypothetical protein RRF57_013258 [Xylaria bambusicola]|uniref:Cyanovirin-N domain-containing protein n=1 Tax=Xylaria bambusicola TaxID=326684 RepID=A0AAN7UXV1_9PEZI
MLLFTVLGLCAILNGASALDHQSRRNDVSGGFTTHCNSHEIIIDHEKVWLKSICNGPGRLGNLPFHPRIDLDLCLTNNKGTLEGSPGGMFSESCNDIHLLDDDCSELDAICFTGVGNDHYVTTIDLEYLYLNSLTRGARLDEIISSEDGKLCCYGKCYSL